MLEFLSGVIIGVFLGGYLAWERFIRYAPRPIAITITPEVLHQVNGCIVGAWLDAHDMVWMPKGPDFKPGEKL
ncbi:hypothetical protein DLREEDagrD3_28750 [Denitratisoma sp. agr-D3]